MPNGEGIVEEVLVKGRYDGEEVTKGIPESIDKGIAAAQPQAKKWADMWANTLRKAPLEEIRKQIQLWAKFKIPVQDAADVMQRLGFNAQETFEELKDGGYKTTELNRALGTTTDATKGLDLSFSSLAKSVQWAIYRFFTTLIIYQALRKVLRAINDTIKEAIRLWKELGEAQGALQAALRINETLFGVQLGTMEEWTRWARAMSIAYGSTTAALLESASAIMRNNEALGLSAIEMQEVVRLGAAIARLNEWWKEGQLDVARGTERVIQAIQGQKTAMEDLLISQENLAEAIGGTVEEFEDLPPAIQELLDMS